MMNYEWSGISIERHYHTFDGVANDNVTVYEYSVSDLQNEQVVVLKGHELPDFVLSVQNINEQGISFFESIRSSGRLSSCETYESHGVIILNSGDDHKTPTVTLSYNKSVYYLITVKE